MPLIDTQLAAGIASLCMGLTSSSQYNQACNKASEAGYKQVGVYKLINDGESKTIQYATTLGQDKLGKTTMETGEAGVFLYKVYKSKSLTFKLPNVGIADQMSNQITPNSYKLNLVWHFQ